MSVRKGLPQIDCACAALRRATRLVTQMYDAEMRPHLKASQFALLTALEHHPGANASGLAGALGYDITTLSRNLRVLERNGWIKSRAGEDARFHRFELTAAGQKVLGEAKPAWRNAQKRLKSAMTDEQWTAMWQAIQSVTSAADRAAGG
jgi:DNA-binding MarR family transcriptional regulator